MIDTWNTRLLYRYTSASINNNNVTDLYACVSNGLGMLTSYSRWMVVCAAILGKRQSLFGMNIWRFHVDTCCFHAVFHDDIIKWKHFLRYWPFERGSVSHRWISLTKAGDAELGCFLWSTPEQMVEQAIGDRWIILTKASVAELWWFPWSTSEQTVEQAIEMSVIWDAIALIMTSL